MRMSKTLNGFLTIGVLMATLSASAATESISPKNLNPVSPDVVDTVILVNGAWADATASWQKLIPLLQKEGIKVVAALNPDTSLKDGVSAVTRAINNQPGKVILVGHSWGGAIITEAGNHDKVAGLIYIAGFAPDVGETVNQLISQYPVSRAFGELKPDAEGFVYLSEKGMAEAFAQDLTAEEIKIMTSTQLPIFGGTLEDKVSAAAWKTKPCLYIVATEDRTIQPALQEMMANRMSAVTKRVQANHVVMVSQAEKVADFIVDVVRNEKANRQSLRH